MLLEYAVGDGECLVDVQCLQLTVSGMTIRAIHLRSIRCSYTGGLSAISAHPNPPITFRDFKTHPYSLDSSFLVMSSSRLEVLNDGGKLICDTVC